MTATDHLGLGQHGVPDDEQTRSELTPAIPRRDALRIGQHRVGARHLAEPERVGLHAAAIDRREQVVRRRPRTPGRPRSDTPSGPDGPVSSTRPAPSPAAWRAGARRHAVPEHMWRIGPAFSPSRARRAAVSASSGIPSAPQARRVWLTPARRNIPWSVRTCRSSPECELARMAISADSRSNALMPPASMSATAPNGLTVERRVTTRSGSPRTRIRWPDASTSTMSPRWTLSSIPLRSCLHEDRRGRTATADGACRGSTRSLSRWCGHGTGTSPWMDGHTGTARIPRREGLCVSTMGVEQPGRSNPTDGGPSCPRRPCTSRSIRPCSTSSRSCATRRPSRRSSARSSASCRGCSATRRSRTSG